jgi:hypothetical protein
MKVAVMQPYFFPYLGYFSLIKNADKFILLDVVQFIRHGWIERNRILKQDNGWLYIQVPLVRHSQGTVIKDIKIDNNKNWQQKIISQLQPYKKVASNNLNVIKLLNELFEKEYLDIVSLNRDAIKLILRYLNIEKQIFVFSEMNLTIETPKAADEWALNICKSLGNVSKYLNPIGGQRFFDRNKYEKAGICLKFHKANLIPYEQKRNNFEPGLSIIDVLMFNEVKQINIMLDNYELQ